MEAFLTPTASGLVKKSKKREVNIHVPWVEKYRPRKISDVVYQDEIVAMLQNIRSKNSNSLPNLLFYGPPGTGKTSTILALAKDMFGQEFSDRVLELNASDERGIQIVREKIKMFSNTKISNNLKSIPAIKLIILDEADSMTPAAQSALRRIMESSSGTTRFCIICNYISRIIEPITSRCSKFRFRPLRDDLIHDKLSQVSKNEGIEFKDEHVLNEIIEICEGDLRRSLTLLQTLHGLKGQVVDEDDGDKMDTDDPETILPKRKSILSLEDVHEVSGYIPNHWLTSFGDACQVGRFVDLEKVIDEMLLNGFSGSQFLVQLVDWVLDPEQSKLRDDQMTDLLSKIAQADHALLIGSSEYLQLLDVGRVLIKVITYPEPVIRRKRPQARLE